MLPEFKDTSVGPLKTSPQLYAVPRWGNSLRSHSGPDLRAMSGVSASRRGPGCPLSCGPAVCLMRSSRGSVSFPSVPCVSSLTTYAGSRRAALCFRPLWVLGRAPLQGLSMAGWLRGARALAASGHVPSSAGHTEDSALLLRWMYTFYFIHKFYSKKRLITCCQ